MADAGGEGGIPPAMPGDPNHDPNGTGPFSCDIGCAGFGEKVDCTPTGCGSVQGGDFAEVFESLKRYDEAIVAAQADIRNFPLHPYLQAQSYATIGRCQANLNKAEEASVAFQSAIAAAQRGNLPFYEMLVHRDYIVHVLDAQGNRETQLAMMGGAISSMVLAPSEYNAILGHGLDADIAVAAFRSNCTGDDDE